MLTGGFKWVDGLLGRPPLAASPEWGGEVLWICFRLPCGICRAFISHLFIKPYVACAARIEPVTSAYACGAPRAKLMTSTTKQPRRIDVSMLPLSWAFALTRCAPPLRALDRAAYGMMYGAATNGSDGKGLGATPLPQPCT
jgi:hypothetical protein